MMTQTLNQIEMLICKLMAEQAWETHKDNGDKTQADVLGRMYGHAGELAFCKAMNIYPGLSLEVMPFDCVLTDHKKVDIKTSSKGQTLYVNTCHSDPENRADIYVAANYAPGSGAVLLHGYATPAGVFKDSNLKEIRGRDVYCVPYSELEPIEAIVLGW